MEDRLRTLESDVAVIKSNYATKADISDLRTEIQKAVNAMTWRMFLIMGGFTGLGVFARWFIR